MAFGKTALAAALVLFAACAWPAASYPALGVLARVPPSSCFRTRPGRPVGRLRGARAARCGSARSVCALSAFEARCTAADGLQPLLVVLDLDETLVHASLSAAPPANRASGQRSDVPSWVPSVVAQPSFDFKADGPGCIVGLGEEVPLYVSLRPGVREFLRWLLSLEAAGIVEVAVYTAGTETYARQTLAELGLDDTERQVLFRQACEPFGLPLTKDLTKLRQDLSRVVLVDNSEKSFWLQPRNGLLVDDWTGRELVGGDRELQRVRGMVERLLEVVDVREELQPEAPLPRVSPVAAPTSLWLVILAVFLVSACFFCLGGP